MYVKVGCWCMVAALSLVGCASPDAEPMAAESTAGGKADDPNGSSDQAAFDVNDVSLLLALDEERPRPLLGLDDPRLQVTEDIFADIEAAMAADPEYPFDPSPQTFQGGRDEWFVVAARYDPCAVEGSTHDFDTGDVLADVDAECLQLLRLVVQPFPTDAFGQHPDAALHVIYALGQGAPAADDPNIAVLQGLKARSAELGAATNGEPLDVHPGLQADLRNGTSDFGDALAEGLTTMLSRSALISIAATSLMQTDAALQAEGGAVWLFVAGDVAEGRWTSKPQELEFTLLDETVSRTKDFMSCARGGCGKRGCIATEDGSTCGPIVPADPSIPSLDEVGNFVPAEVREGWAANAHAIDDPLAFDIPEVACADCHMTRGTFDRFQVHSSPERRTPPAGITGYGSCNALRGTPWNTRNFGYFERKATVSTRTALETAFAADFVNQRVLGVDNPGKDCSTVDEEVWECLVHAPGQPQDSCSAAHNAQCFASCESARQ